MKNIKRWAIAAVCSVTVMGATVTTMAEEPKVVPVVSPIVSTSVNASTVLTEAQQQTVATVLANKRAVTKDTLAKAEENAQKEAQAQEEAQAQADLASKGEQIVDYALQYVGNPYVYGGTSLTGGTDCSGFTMGVYAAFGYSLNRTSRDQVYNGTSVTVEEAQAGDLVFYAYGGTIGHVGIYMGDGQIVHAGTEATGICTTDLYACGSPYAIVRVI